jgi:type II secretory pathway pseudopilin PulG
MKRMVRNDRADGFSLIELMISILILMPIMGAAMSLFSVGVQQQASEQSSIEATQEARTGFELMTTEIAQAGSHGDRSAVLSMNVPASTAVQTVTVSSTTGITAGDFVDVDTGANHEIVEITGVTSTTLSGIFRTAHVQNKPVRLFALPYLTGVVPPAGMAANSTVEVTTLRLFGDINGDSTVQYVEYIYDSNSNQITRSITPITQAEKNPALPIMSNVKPNSVRFALRTDGLGAVTSVDLALTTQSSWKTGSQYQESQLSSKVVIPCAVSGSVLLYEIRRYGGVDRLPPTPSKVTTWTSL